jgi:hypothetical protein
MIGRKTTGQNRDAWAWTRENGWMSSHSRSLASYLLTIFTVSTASGGGGAQSHFLACSDCGYLWVIDNIGYLWVIDNIVLISYLQYTVLNKYTVLMMLGFRFGIRRFSGFGFV